MLAAIRRAFTLLEVVLALAILTITLAVALGLLDLGVRNARDARDQSRAQELAESVISLITSGVLLPNSTSGPVAVSQILADAGTNLGANELGAESDDDDWQCEIFVDTAADENMSKVSVTISDGATTNPVEFTLVRWMIDAQHLQDLAALDAEAASSASSSASSTSSSTPSNGSSPSSTTPGTGGQP